MKMIISAFALVLFMAGAAFAHHDVITFPAKNGAVQFNHKKHEELVKKNCKTCHEKAPGKMEGFGKDKAHKLCLDCHKSQGKGPVTCKECHVKK